MSVYERIAAVMADVTYLTRDCDMGDFWTLSDERVTSAVSIVPADCFNREENAPYALGPVEDREAVLLFNERTKKTAQDTIEYFI